MMLTSFCVAAAAAGALEALQDDGKALKDSKTGRSIQVGDRVQLTLKSRYTIRGIVEKPHGAADGYDPSTQETILLNLTLEHDRLDGTMTVQRLNIRGVEVLQPLSPQQRAEILRRKKVEKDKLTLEDHDRMADQNRRYQEWEDARLRALTKPSEKSAEAPKKTEPSPSAPDAQALAIYKEFPEADGWGPEKFAQLQKVLIPTLTDEVPYLDSRKPIPDPTGRQNYAPADAKEGKFVKNYEHWVKGRELHLKAEAEKKKAEEQPQPQPPKEGSGGP